MPRKTGKLLVADFTKRSKKGLDFAKAVLRSENIADAKVQRALEHYLINWGNFSQVGLFSVACEAVGGNPDSNLSTQAALAMIVAAFDIHDDIIDRSIKKHERYTVYGKFGQDTAILLGNAFMIEGMKLFADSAALLPGQRGKQALDVLKNHLFEIGNAHSLELSYRNAKSNSLPEYLRIIDMKSASIEADILLGAIFGGAEEIRGLTRLGRILGNLIMLREEFVDLYDVEELLQRIAVGDLPLPIIAAMQEESVRSQLTSIMSSSIEETKTKLLLKVTINSEPVKKLKEKMQLLIDEGINLTCQLPPTKLQDTLQNLLKFMLEDL